MSPYPITEQEHRYLDIFKKSGHVISRCRDCGFRGFGRPASMHTTYHPGHRLVNEEVLEREEREANRTSSGTTIQNPIPARHPDFNIRIDGPSIGKGGQW